MQVYYGAFGYYRMVFKAYMMVLYDFCFAVKRKVLKPVYMK